MGNNYNDLRNTTFVVERDGAATEYGYEGFVKELENIPLRKPDRVPADDPREVAFRRQTAQKIAAHPATAQKTVERFRNNRPLRDGITMASNITGCPVEDHLALLAEETSGGSNKTVHTKPKLDTNKKLLIGRDGKPVLEPVSKATGDFQLLDTTYYDFLRRYGPQYMDKMTDHIRQQHPGAAGVRMAHDFKQAIGNIKVVDGKIVADEHALLPHKNEPFIQATLVGARRQELVASGMNARDFRLVHTYGRTATDALLAAKPDAPVDSVLSVTAIANNKIPPISVGAFLEDMERHEALAGQMRAQLQIPQGAPAVTRVAATAYPPKPAEKTLKLAAHKPKKISDLIR